MSEHTPLRLIAETEDDLNVISAAVQDCVVKAGNLKYDARARRFSLEINRYGWESGQKNERRRIRSLLAVDGVLSVKTRAITKTDPELVMSLLQLTFEAADEPPGGVLTLLFAGDGELRLEVEVMDVTLLDSNYVWPTNHTPKHDRRK